MLLFINGMAFDVTTLENNSRAFSKMLAVLFTAALLVLSSAQSPNEGTKPYRVGDGDFQEKEWRKERIRGEKGQNQVRRKTVQQSICGKG